MLIGVCLAVRMHMNQVHCIQWTQLAKNNQKKENGFAGRIYFVSVYPQHMLGIPPHTPNRPYSLKAKFEEMVLLC